MSWDVSICKFPQHYATVDEIPSDQMPIPLGTRAEIHRAVLEVFPGTDWKGPVWGVWDSEYGAIEFNLGDSDPLEGFMLHVRAGAEVVGGIVQLCIDNGWQGVDLNTGEFVEVVEDPEQGLELWRAFRDRILSP